MEEKFITCGICGAPLKSINSAHLQRHGMTVRGYAQSFPDAPLISEDVRKKFSEVHKGQTPWNKGKTWKDDPRILAGDRHPKPQKGKKRSIEIRESISLKLKGRPKSEETRKKMSLWQKGIPKPFTQVMNCSHSLAEEKSVISDEWKQHLQKISREYMSRVKSDPEDFQSWKNKRVTKMRKDLAKHNEVILALGKNIKEKGYRYIPIHVKNLPKPDAIIVTGDNIRIYGVEVQISGYPEWLKYKNIEWFDDVIWVLDQHGAIVNSRGDRVIL